MALKQHLGNAGGSSEVTVDLKWRMLIPKIICRSVFQQIAQERMGMVSVAETRPVVEFPAHRPSGCRITALTQGLAGGVSKFGICQRIDSVTRMKSEEMVCMAVGIAVDIYIAAPFLKLTVATDAVGQDTVEFRLPAGTVGDIRVESFCGADRLGKNLTRDSVGVGRSGIARPVLGRI